MSAQTPPPGQLVSFRLWQLSNRWQQLAQARLKPLDLTHVQYLLLDGVYRLAKKKVMVTQKRLAIEVQTDVMMTSKVVRSLAGKQFLIRASSRQDARSKSLALTSKGANVLHEGHTIMHDLEAELFCNEQRGVVDLFINNSFGRADKVKGA